MVLLNRGVPLCFIVVKPFQLPVAAVGEFVGCESECEVAVAPAGVRGGGGEVVDVVVRHGWIFGFVGFKEKSGAVGENGGGGVLEVSVEGWAVVPVYVAKGRSGKFHE